MLGDENLVYGCKFQKRRTQYAQKNSALGKPERKQIRFWKFCLKRPGPVFPGVVWWPKL